MERKIGIAERNFKAAVKALNRSPWNRFLKVVLDDCARRYSQLLEDLDQMRKVALFDGRVAQ